MLPRIYLFNNWQKQAKLFCHMNQNSVKLRTSKWKNVTRKTRVEAGDLYSSVFLQVVFLHSFFSLKNHRSSIFRTSSTFQSLDDLQLVFFPHTQTFLQSFPSLICFFITKNYPSSVYWPQVLFFWLEHPQLVAFLVHKLLSNVSTGYIPSLLYLFIKDHPNHLYCTLDSSLFLLSLNSFSYINKMAFSFFIAQRFFWY